jgi:hypothetical protein
MEDVTGRTEDKGWHRNMKNWHGKTKNWCKKLADVREEEREAWKVEGEAR